MENKIKVEKRKPFSCYSKMVSPLFGGNCHPYALDVLTSLIRGDFKASDVYIKWNEDKSMLMDVTFRNESNYKKMYELIYKRLGQW